MLEKFQHCQRSTPRSQHSWRKKMLHLTPWEYTKPAAQLGHSFGTHTADWPAHRRDAVLVRRAALQEHELVPQAALAQHEPRGGRNWGAGEPAPSRLSFLDAS